MRHRVALGAFAVMTLAVAGVVAQEGVKSGIPVGKSVSPFHPLNVTGKYAGQKQCLVWAHGGNPVAVIFARKVTDPLTSLVKKIDATTAKNKSVRMGSFVVFLSEDEDLADKLKALAKEQDLDNCALTIDNPAGPPGYQISKNAEVTVLLYNKRKVLANHAFGPGQLDEQGVERVVADLKKIVPVQ